MRNYFYDSGRQFTSIAIVSPHVLSPLDIQFAFDPNSYRYTVGSFVSVSSPTKDLFDRLGELQNRYAAPSLPYSTAPSEQAFKDAKAFILTLPLAQIDRPSIKVAADGEVNFQWSGRDFKIDLGFYGDGRFSYFARKAGFAPVTGDDVPVVDGLPKNVELFASAI